MGDVGESKNCRGVKKIHGGVISWGLLWRGVNDEQINKLTLEAVKTGSKAMIYRVSKKIAGIQCTQKPFSGYIYLICRVLVHVYLLTCCFSQCRVFILKLNKLIIHVLSENEKKDS